MFNHPSQPQARPFHLLLGLLMLAIILPLTGCGANGQRFSEVQPAPEQAVIYVYRHNAYQGSAVTLNIHVNDEKIGGLKTSGYLYKIVPPGTHLVRSKTESESSVEVLAQPNQSYYIEADVVMGIFVGRPELRMVPPDIGRANIGGKYYSGKMAEGEE